MEKYKYKNSRIYQTPEFVQKMRSKKISTYLPFRAIINQLENIYDPITHQNILKKSINSAEFALQNNKSDWFVLTTFIKNIGNILYVLDEPENLKSISNYTFITGCAFPKQIIYPEFNSFNNYSPNGIYKPHCGLNNTYVSYNPNEFLFQTLNNDLNKHLLPPEALYCIRYGNLYLHHRDNAYEHLIDDYDKAMLPLLQEFDKYDNCNVTIDVTNVLLKKYEILWKMFFENYGLYF